MRRRRVRWLLATVLAATVVSAGCTSGGDENGEGAAPPPAPAQPTIFPVVDLPPAQVHRLAVDGQGRSAALVRTSSATWLAEPSTPEATISLVTESE